MSWHRSTLLDQVAHPMLLRLAYDDVRRADGAPGVDGMTLERFGQGLDVQLQLLSDQLRRHRFEPLPVRSVHIPKPDGGMRALGIPCVRDRVAGRAIQRVLGLLRTRGTQVVILDIRDYFPSIHRGLLLSFLTDALKGDPLVSTVERLLAVTAVGKGALEGLGASGDSTSEARGIWQGSPLSPLLANLYLHPWDKRLTREGVGWVRYSDNAVLITDSEADAQSWLEEARADLSRLHLTLHAEKSRVVDGRDGFPFLGFFVRQQGIGPEVTSLSRLEEKLVTLAGEDDGRMPSERVAVRRTQLQGWLNYYASLAGIPVTDGYTLAAALELVGKRGDRSAAQALLRAEMRSGPEAHSAAEVDEALSWDPEAEEQIRRTLLTFPALRSLLRADGQTLQPLPPGFPHSRSARAAHPQAPLASRPPPPPPYGHGAPCPNAIPPRLTASPPPAPPPSSAPARSDGSSAELEPWSLAEQHLCQGDFRQAMNAAIRLGAQERALSPAPASEPSEDAAEEEGTPTRAPELAPLAAPVSPPSPSQPSRGGQLRLSAQQLAVLSGVFATHPERHARMWVDRLGRRGYAPVLAPLDSSAWQRHLSGEETLAIPLAHAGRFRALVLDIDLERPLLERIRDSAHELTVWLERTHQHALRLLEGVQALGLEALLEDSGQKGRHLWCFLEPSVGARDAFTLLKRWTALAGAPPEGIHVELIPADSHRPAEGGPLVTLPLGIHLQSGRRSRLFDRRGREVHDVETQLMPLLRGLVRWDDSARLRLLQGEASAQAEVQETLPEAQAERVARVLRGCPVVAWLLKKAQEIGHLNHRERLTLLHVFGHLEPEGVAFLHAVMALCPHYDPRITEKYVAALKASPLSCARVREWVPEVLRRVPCQCVFRVPSGLFPSPLLHLEPALC